MSEPDGGDPETAIKSIIINKVAQAAVCKLDVLVCGQCHYVFHFVEEFVEHKSLEKCGKPAFRTSITEDKPQVWAFLLWKSTVSLKEKESSWALYQRWCKLENDVRSTWTAAGQAILECSSLAVKIEGNIWRMESQLDTLNKSSSMASEAESEAELGTTTSDKSPIEKDTEKSVEKAEEVIITKRRRGRPRRDEVTPKVEPPTETPPTRGRPRKILHIAPNVKATEEKASVKKESSPEASSQKEDKKTGPRVIKMTRSAVTLLKTVKPGPKKRLMSAESEEATSTPTPKKNPMATRSKKKGEESEDDDFVVEKILAKRLNQKNKEYEYLLKWEGYPHEQNTWEPLHNMKECEVLVENFERSLAKQKANQQAAGHKVITKVVKMPPKPVVAAAGPSDSRPIRSSKVKAMENVKSWCGSMGKRKNDGDSDSEESTPEKRIKVEPLSDLMDEGSADELDDKKTPGLLKSLSLVKSPVGNIKKQLIASIAINGMAKSPESVKKTLTKSPVSQPPVLVANSKGIIKLDSRQVPNLSSGVYIVSNQAGIVKLDQTSSPPSTTTQTQPKTVTSGVVRKIATELSPKQIVPAEVKSTTPDVKLLPKGSPSGLVRVPSTSNLARKRSPLTPLTGPRPLRVLGPRPLSTLQQRPGLKPGQRPPFVPRPPQILRPPIRPSFPAGPRILMKPNTSPAAQVKSGMRPIQAMLGGSMSSQSVITVSMPQTVTPGATPLKAPLTQKLLVPIKGKKLVAKPSTPVVLGLNGKPRDSKLVDNDSLHMEFQEVESSSSEDDGVESLPEMPPGEVLSPPGSPLPLTLCPLTGKILGRAEGEPTPPPSPEPSQILPDLDGEDEDCLKAPVLGSVLPTLESTPTLFEIPPDLEVSGEECLKVEMSPGGTTGTVVNMGGQPFDDPVDSLHSEGVTVTKLMSNEGGSDADDDEQEQEYVTITGEDGVVYQMVTNGNNLMEGQVLMGDDGQQVYVTGTQDQQLTLDTAVAEAVSQLIPGDTDESQDAGDDSTQAQVVAQIVEEGETTPGGMRRVVLLLPDGNFMMTEVDEDQYAALDLDSSDTSPTK